MGSYQSSTSAAPLYAASSETGRVKLGRGTSSTRADKAAIRPRIQALRYAFAAETIGSVPSVPVFLVPVFLVFVRRGPPYLPLRNIVLESLEKGI